jgi:ABC-2 type transport system permease protein
VAWFFLTLRWRVLRNSWSGATGGQVMSRVLGMLVGLVAAVAGVLLLATSGGSSPDIALTHTALIGTVVTALWLVAPLMYGADDALRPDKFALLPLTRRQLSTGLLVASLVSLPVAVTLLATSGTIVAAARHGILPALVAVLGVLVGLAVCLFGGRVVTAVFARLLRSRRARDLATFAVFLISVGSWLGWAKYSSLLLSGSWETWLPGARVLSWTPLAAAYSAWSEAADGHGVAAMAKLAIGCATVLALRWWWGRLLASLMTAGPGTGRSAGSVRSSVRGLLPRRLLPATPTGAVVARILRIWVRDPRFRIALAVNLVYPVVMFLLWRSAPAGLLAAIAGSTAGLGVINTFGYDGPAYANQLLAAVPGRIDLRARILANVVPAVPTVLLTVVIVGVVRGDPAGMVSSVGIGLAAFGCSAAVAVLLSVRAPFVPAPPEKPFATPPGGQGQAMIGGYGALLGGVALSAPILAAVVLVPSLAWLALPLGLAWGAGAAEFGVLFGGRWADQRGPEILAAVAPRR